MRIHLKFSPQVHAQSQPRSQGGLFDVAGQITAFNEDLDFLCVSYDQSNVHENAAVGPGAAFEVAIDELFPRTSTSAPWPRRSRRRT